MARGLERVLPRRWSGWLLRWMAAVGSQAFFRWCQRFPGAARRILRKGVERELPTDYDIDTHFSPTYDPWDQRLCVDPEGVFFGGGGELLLDHVHFELFGARGAIIGEDTELFGEAAALYFDFDNYVEVKLVPEAEGEPEAVSLLP